MADMWVGVGGLDLFLRILKTGYNLDDVPVFWGNFILKTSSTRVGCVC